MIKHKLEGKERFCPECGTKYKVVTTETVKYLKFIPARFEVVEEITYIYACPKCGMMKRPQKDPALLKGSIDGRAQRIPADGPLPIRKDQGWVPSGEISGG